MLYVGGNWSNGSNAGLWYANGNNSDSNSNSNIGGRLSLCLKNKSLWLRLRVPLPLGKKQSKRERLSRFFSKRRQTKRDRGFSMKRKGFLYEQIYDKENILRAIQNASKGKRDRRFVQRILNNADAYAQKISEMLREECFTPSESRQRVIHDGASGKERLISVPRFYPDQIVHWAVIQVIQPILSKGMYRYCCGSVPKRGGLDAKKYVERVLRKRDARYVLKLDIRKFYPSIQHDKLKALLRKRIKDERTLALLSNIIDTGGAGLPIGFYTSQWLANFYLQEVDCFIKQTLKVKYYVRYVDDMVLFGSNKRKLRKDFKALRQFLHNEGYGLEIKDNWQLWRRHTRPVDFVGYRFFRGYTLLRKKLLYRLMRTVRRIKRFGLNIRRARRFNSLLAWASHINFKEYYLARIKPIVSKRAAKRYISEWGLRHDSTAYRLCAKPL